MTGPESAMLGGRQAAEALMVDRCVITEAATEGVFDEETGEYAVDEAAVVYLGPCKVQRTALEPRGVEAGERIYSIEEARVDVPISASGIKVEHRVTVLKASYDRDLVGLSMRIVGVSRKTWATARRLRCTEEV